MIENLIVKFGARYVRSKFSGYTTQIGVVLGLITVGVSFVAKIFEIDMPGVDKDYSQMIADITQGVQILMGGASGTAVYVGTVMKGFKGGLKQPCPPELCPPEKWDGKVPGQFP